MGKKNRVKSRDQAVTTVKRKRSTIPWLLVLGRTLRKPSNLAMVFVLGVFSLPMLFRDSFYVDWTNHVWVVQHFRELILQGQVGPDFLNVKDAKFESLTLFYGTFFYPFFAILSIPFGADFTVKIVALSLIALIFRQTFKLLSNLGKSQTYAILAAIIVSTPVYALTNFYNRSALTEFFAIQLLTASLVVLLSALVSHSQHERIPIRLGAGFILLILALTTHPIVAFTSGIFVVPTLLIFLVARWKAVDLFTKKLFIGFSIGALSIIGPTYFLIGEYRSDFPIGNDTYLTVFPDSIDSLFARIGIVYIDSRIFGSNLEAVSTPFLNAPLGIPIIGYLIMLMVKNIRNSTLTKINTVTYAVISACVASLIGCLLIVQYQTPETPGLWLEISRALAPIQFLYRLSGTLHLLVVVSIIICEFIYFESPGKENTQPLTPKRLKFFASLASFALCFHTGLTLFEFVGNKEEPNTSRSVSENILSDESFYRPSVHNTGYFPPTFYGMRAYNMEKGLPVLEASKSPVTFVEVSPNKPIKFECESQSCLVKTDVYPSKLITLKVDGQTYNEQTLVDRNLGFKVGNGRHVVEVAIVENLVTWIKISFAALLVIVSLLTFAFFRSLLEKPKIPKA